MTVPPQPLGVWAPYSPTVPPARTQPFSAGPQEHLAYTSDVIAYIGNHPISSNSLCTEVLVGNLAVALSHVKYQEKNVMLFIFSVCSFTIDVIRIFGTFASAVLSIECQFPGYISLT